VDVDWGKALKGKWGEAIKAIKVNQKLKITSGPNVHVVELNMKVSDPFKARYAYESDSAIPQIFSLTGTDGSCTGRCKAGG